MFTSAHDPNEPATASVEFQYVEADFIAAYQLHAAATRTIWILLLILALVLVAATLIHLREVSRTMLVVAIILVGAVVSACRTGEAFPHGRFRCPPASDDRNCVRLGRRMSRRLQAQERRGIRCHHAPRIPVPRGLRAPRGSSGDRGRSQPGR